MRKQIISTRLVTFFVTTALLLLGTTTIVDARKGFHDRLTSLDQFVVAHNWGPERWGSAYNKSQVHASPEGTKITIGKDSLLKPYSCGEIIYKEENLGYGYYSVDILASDVIGQVTGFFLIANKDPAQSEIDIELTGLNSELAWMNVWHNHDSKPTPISVDFDAAKGWHNYMMEWRKDYIVWYIDGQVVLNRTDVVTTPPDKANYRLAINSWTQVQPETKLAWAGKFEYPTDGTIPTAQFRNLKVRPASASQFSPPKSKTQGVGSKNNGELVSNSLDMSKIAFDDDGEDVDDGSGAHPPVSAPVAVPAPARLPTPPLPASKAPKKPAQSVPESSRGGRDKPNKKQGPAEAKHRKDRPSGPKRLQFGPVDLDLSDVLQVEAIVGEGIAQQWF
ncbi:hypothetical protein BGZ83_005160 [Gryganskiella cystojenkinii]|nr:hypothetical protein BGZ83_005160 [Gryganskiella cystojenkinii]